MLMFSKHSFASASHYIFYYNIIYFTLKALSNEYKWYKKMSEIEIDAETAPLWHLLTSNEVFDEAVLLEVYKVREETGKSFAKLLVVNGLIEEQDLLKLYASFWKPELLI